MLYNAALVLEGGAFRGQYTAGIVDTFLAHHIEFRSVIGVSAGSLCGVNFVSKQYGRAANININHRHDRQYISMARVFKKQIINLDYLFEDHGYSWQNFNEAAYRRSASHFTAVATSVKTGKTVLFTDPVGEELTNALKLPHQCHFFQIHRKHPRDLALMVGSQIQFHLILHNNKDMTRLLLSGLGMLTTERNPPVLL